MARFPIQFDSWYAWLSRCVLVPPADAFIDVLGGEVSVRMGWAFRARFTVTAVHTAHQTDKRPISWGVHGFAGRWLVNGSNRNILVIDLDPVQRGYVMGFPVKLRQLNISVTDPQSLSVMLLNK